MGVLIPVTEVLVEVGVANAYNAGGMGRQNRKGKDSVKGTRMQRTWEKEKERKEKENKNIVYEPLTEIDDALGVGSHLAAYRR